MSDDSVIRCSPTEPNPTHHIALSDRSGKKIGLLLCDDEGKPIINPRFQKTRVDTTALKQTSGNSGYADYDYPYSPIVQDDLSGGRGSSDFERDSTKYYDSFRAKSGRANKAYAGPQESYAKGLRTFMQTMPGSVRWQTLTENSRYLYKRFQVETGFTAARIWIRTRIKGQPGDLTVAIYNDNSGSVGTLVDDITVPYTRKEDVLAEWLNELISGGALTTSTYYWIVVYGASSDSQKDHWKIAVKNQAGTSFTSTTFTSTPTAATVDLYYRLTPADSEKTCIPFEYQEMQYFVVSGASGAPQIFMAGYRGAADDNSADMTKLNDATQTWTTDELVGGIALVIDGPGKEEAQPWRRITANVGTVATVDSPWLVTHTTSTVYVILLDKVREITGHGLTAPVTDVLVSTTGIVYFCMGDSVTVRRLRAFNDAGTWKDFDNASCQADETATTKAVYMIYKPQAQKIVIGNNSDASGNVSVSTMSNASVPAWGTALTWSAAVNVDSKFRRINGMIVYPDAAGTEAVWVFKTDIPFIVPASGNPYPVNLPEMRVVRSNYNGAALLTHGVYIYFSMQYGLTRYYNGQFDDIGPNLGEGLPTKRRGPIVAMQEYPGKFFVAIDAGSSGYSSVMDSDGWHERYRAPYGQRIKTMAFQVLPGPTLDRLWLYQGNDLVVLPFPSETVNELEDASFPYTDEFAVTLSRMHAGMFDVQKLVKIIKLQTENLSRDETTGDPVCWFEIDYRLNEETEWQSFDEQFVESPTQSINLIENLGIAGKRLQLRVRGYTSNNLISPVLIAIIVSAVIRVDVKYMYNIQFLVADMERSLGFEPIESAMSAAEKLAYIEAWSDASSDSMLKMESVSILYHDKVVFLNPPDTRQVLVKEEDGNEFKRNVLICNASVQEA